MRALGTSALSWFFLALFLASLAGQAIAGHADHNADQIDHAGIEGVPPETISLGRYVTSSEFWNAVMENWQSEYLQFTVFLMATIWLVQRGSTESKAPGDEGRESDEKQKVGKHAEPDSPRWAAFGDWRTRVYENSLLLVMGAVFLLSWIAQSLTGWSMHNADQLEHDSETVSWLGYLGTGEFWETTLENWQSEFLAVGSMVALSIYLRQRGSPQSKPVGAPHEATAVEG